MEIRISELNKNFSMEDLIKISEKFLLVIKELPTALIPQMPLELAVIEICSQIGTKVNFDYKDSNNSSVVNNEKKINSNSSIKKEEIEKQWPEFLTRLKPHNHSLSFVMQSCQIKDVDNDIISLAFKYKFHKDRLDSPDINKIVKSVLFDVFKTDLKIKALVDENLEINNKNNNNEIIDDLLKTFGGEVIN
jgi:hypothetical protein